MQNHPVFLVDSSVFIFRAFYSVPDHFNSPNGEVTNAVYGFTSTLCNLLEKEACQQIVVAFDEALESSFRNEIYPEYKANRDPAPEDLKKQFQWCRDVTEALGIQCYSSNRFEADDLIGTFSRIAHDRARSTRIISTDKDLAQLMIEGDLLVDPNKQKSENIRDIYQRFGVHPHQIADFLALAGDSVDNIPGIPGIGPKAASALLGHFGDFDSIFSRVDEVGFLSFRGAKSAQKKLKEHESLARTCRQLTQIEQFIEDISDDIDFNRQAIDHARIDSLFNSFGFGHGLRQRINRLK